MPTKIEWATESWNPVTGCTKVSDGCKFCWAERMAMRFTGHFNVTCYPDRLDQPLHWKKPRRIFVCSMGDLFHEDVPYMFMNDVVARVSACDQHQFLILTKRLDRMLEYMTEKIAVLYEKWPLPNLWLGVTTENQEQADKRIPILLQIPAAKRFVSIEPMLGPVNLFDVSEGVLDGIGVIKSGGMTASTPDSPPEGYDDSYSGIDWVIVGAESGPKRRFLDNNHVRDVVFQCQQAGIPVFVKQLHDRQYVKNHKGFKIVKKMAEWPENLRIRKYPS